MSAYDQKYTKLIQTAKTEDEVTNIVNLIWLDGYDAGITAKAMGVKTSD